MEVNEKMNPLLRRAFLFLEDGDWASADSYCERVLDQEPENAYAYVGKLMAELQKRTMAQLKDHPGTFESNANYKKAIRFGDAKLKQELQDINKSITKRNEQQLNQAIYDAACTAMNQARTPASYREAAKRFDRIPGFQNADTLKARCLKKADDIEKQAAFQAACTAMAKAGTRLSFNEAAEKFQQLGDYPGAVERKEECLRKAEECRKDFIYMRGKLSMDAGTIDGYDKAIPDFRSIEGWKDSSALLKKCREQSRALKKKQAEDAEREAILRKEAAQREEARRKDYLYTQAWQNSKSDTIKIVEEAIQTFQSLNGWKDSKEQIQKCNDRIVELKKQERERAELEEKRKKAAKTRKNIFCILIFVVVAAATAVGITYFRGVNFAKEGDFSTAKRNLIFSKVYDYFDVNLNAYVDAGIDFEQEKYEEAQTEFSAIAEYRDSSSYLEKCAEALFVPVEDIQFEDETIEIYVGESLELHAVVTPANATEQDYKLFSYRAGVVSVDGKAIYARKAGICTVAAKQNGKKYGTIRIVVKDVEPTSFNFRKSELDAKIGDSLTPELILQPDNVSDFAYTMVSSDSGVVTVNDDQTLQCIGEGSATITATHPGSGLSSELTIHVTPVVMEDFQITNATSLQLGDSVQAKVSFTPENTTDQNIQWYSSNGYVINIENGQLVAKHIGSATITAKYSNGEVRTVSIEVLPVEATRVALSESKLTLVAGESSKLTATVFPSNTTDPTVTWTSSDPTVAKVYYGTITAVKPGNAIIYVETKNGKKAQMKVTVKPKPVQQSNGFVTAPYGQRLNEMTVHAPKDYSVYIVMKSTVATNTNNYSIFVNKGSSVTVKVPSGKYYLYYASGETWYGKEYYFGDDTKFYQLCKEPTSSAVSGVPRFTTVEIVDFEVEFQGNSYTYTTYELTLERVAGGNADSAPVDEDSFPDI